MIRFRSSINISFFIIIIIFLFTRCGEPFVQSDFYINNQSDYDLICELYHSPNHIAVRDSIISKSLVKVYEDEHIGRSPLPPSLIIEIVRFYLITNDSLNNMLVYELNPLTDNRLEIIKYNPISYELLIENSDLDLNYVQP